jgi:hypothetical protein
VCVEHVLYVRAQHWVCDIFESLGKKLAKGIQNSRLHIYVINYETCVACACLLVLFQLQNSSHDLSSSMFFRFYLLSGDVPYRGHNDSLCSKSNMQKLNVSKVDGEEMKKMLIDTSKTYLLSRTLLLLFLL